MADKTKYIKRFKEIYEKKNGVSLSDDKAFEYFENLVCLVEAVTGHTDIKKIILPKKYGRRQNRKS